MKKTVYLTESELRNVVCRSLSTILSEAGHIYSKNDDGTIFTNSNETWLGVPGTTFIWHGEWSDPTILYKGKEYNLYDVEEFVADDHDVKYDDSFNEWVRSHPSEVVDSLEEMMYCYEQTEETDLDESTQYPSKAERIKEFKRNLSLDMFGTETFEEFYKEIDFWANPRDVKRVQLYLRRVQEFIKELEETEC